MLVGVNLEYGVAYVVRVTHAQDEKCCLCEGAHRADYSSCPVHFQEKQLLEVMDRRRCSRREAMTVIKERAQCYAGITARQNAMADASIAQTIEAAVEKAMSKAMDRLFTSLSECLYQIMNTQLTQLINNTTAPPQKRPSLPAQQEARCGMNEDRQPLDEIREVNKSTGSEGRLHTLDLSVNTDVEIDSRAQKRSRSPLNPSSSLSPEIKTKKAPTSKVIKESILEKIVSTVGISNH